jgi:hypothetical protein
MTRSAIVEEVRIRDHAIWKSAFFSAVPLIFWLAVCFYFWSVDELDRFQVAVAIVMLAAFVYYVIIEAFWRVFISTHGVVIKRWRNRSISWREIADFEVKSQFFRGRSLCVVLKDGSRVLMPAPTPGNPWYEENLQRLLDWKMAHGDSESERSQAEE